ncbi:hypothetical protein DXG01_010902 [Tephrocybe rancida]|nr:hypothetical protein DXG01_010902 [Tephrocybe rancida]
MSYVAIDSAQSVASIEQTMDLMRLETPTPTRSVGKSKSKSSRSKPKPTDPPLPNNPAIKDQIVLPVPRHTRANRDRRFVYGFDVPEEWLVAYCDKYGKKSRNYTPDAHPASKAIIATNILRAASGVRLNHVLVFPKGMDPSTDPSDPYGKKVCMCLLTVCTSMRISYTNRPSKPRLDKLTSILGREPDWYVDANPKSFYLSDRYLDDSK